jgi:serine/threonine protein phosphatase PrpC
VSVIYTQERLIVPNIGNSRAVLGRFDYDTKKYKAIDLSSDHKPTEKDEAKRIIENDGRIQPFTEEVNLWDRKEFGLKMKKCLVWL